MELSNDVLDQYSRQMLVDEIGYDGQVRLLETPVRVEGPYLWRDLVVRYVKGAGFRVTEAESDALTVIGAGKPPLVIPIGESFGQTVRDIGLQLAAWLADVVNPSPDPKSE